MASKEKRRKDKAAVKREFLRTERKQKRDDLRTLARVLVEIARELREIADG